MTPNLNPLDSPLEQQALQERYAAQLAVERTRLLYQGSLLPTLLMLLNGGLCAWLSWTPQHYLGVSGGLLWLLLLVAGRVIQVAAFDAAMPDRQAQGHWRRMFIVGSAVSGATLAAAAIALVSEDNLIQQAWVFGLLGAATLSASVAYAVSLPAFLAYTLPCLLPPTAYLFVWNDGAQRGWGWFGLIFLGALLVVAWQVNRLTNRSLLRRFRNQELIETLQLAQSRSERLNQALTTEVGQRREAQQQLAQAHAELETRVQQRSRELDQANRALGKSEQRLALALEASGLGLWDWNLSTDEVYHTQLKELFGLEPEFMQAMLKQLRPRMHPEDVPRVKRAMIDHLKGRSDDYLVQYRIRHHEGHWLWIEDHGRAVERAADGSVLRMVGTRRDASRDIVLSGQLQLAGLVFDNSSEGILVLDAQYKVLTSNPAFSRITGLAADQVCGRAWLQLPCSRDARRCATSIQHAMDAVGAWQGVLTETRLDGEQYRQWLQLIGVRNTRGEIHQTIVLLTDVSARIGYSP
jgi:PAS domain S-box-containing protein